MKTTKHGESQNNQAAVSQSQSPSCYAVRIPNKNRLSNPPENSAVFEITGAGFIAFGSNTNHQCGKSIGCAFDNSWNEWGYSGGVMDRKEMERLRDHLTAVLEHNVIGMARRGEARI